MSGFTVDWSQLIALGDEFGIASAEVKVAGAIATKAAAEVVAISAKGRAPKLTGRLASTIRVSSDGAYEAVTAGTGIEYAGVQENGWAAHSIAAHHFISGAVSDMEPERLIEEGTLLAMHGLV